MLPRTMWPVLGALALSACAGTTPPVPDKGGAVQAPANAIAAGVVAGPSFSALNISDAQAQRALDAFKISCPQLSRRADASHLTVPEDWQPICAAAETTDSASAAAFFRDRFETVRVSDGKGFATGYFEPEIAGSRTASAEYAVPIYRRPDDLIEVDLGLFSEKLKGRRIRGRAAKGALIPYYDRTAIESGALANRGLEIGWAADAIDLFFLQIQGSGRMKLPDGGVMRIGYDGQNGRDYTAIGKLLRERGELAPGKAGMDEIVRWLRDNPEKGRALMRENKSYIFFRELTGAGPLGALGVPVTPRVTVAADPAFVPLGAPVVLALDRSEANGLWIAQDVGGAIKGANRFDTFWGAGSDAATLAGGMSARGTALLLLPKGALARVKQRETGRGEADRDPQTQR